MGTTRGRPTSPRAITDDAFEIADRLHSAAIHLLRRLRRADSASGIPGPRLSALSVLVFAGPMTVSELAAAEQVRPPTMTRVIASLEASRLVVREGDAADRRLVRVRATARGVQVLEEGRRRRIALLVQALEELPQSERDTLRAALDSLERIVGMRHRPAQQANVIGRAAED
jgi:DNA-binding MarR family transcriptional regulator